MKIIFIVLLCIISGVSYNALAFTIKDFKLEAFDVSAVTYRRVTDSNEDAALIKIALPLKNVEINGNTVGNIEQINGEYWVYLDPGSISLTLTNSDGKDIEVRFANYGISTVGKSCTYKLDCKLTEEEQKIVFENNKRKEKTEFKKPQHLSVAYKIKGEQFYMTHKEWLQQPDAFFFNIDIQGLVIEFGGKKFIYKKRHVEDKDFISISMNWEDVQKYLRNNPDERLMTKAEAEYLLSIRDEFNKANEAGLDGGAPYFTDGLPETWLSDYPNDKECWVVSQFLNDIVPFEKAQKMTLRTVIDIKE